MPHHMKFKDVLALAQTQYAANHSLTEVVDIFARLMENRTVGVANGVKAFGQHLAPDQLMAFVEQTDQMGEEYKSVVQSSVFETVARYHWGREDVMRAAFHRLPPTHWDFSVFVEWAQNPQARLLLDAYLPLVENGCSSLTVHTSGMAKTTPVSILMSSARSNVQHEIAASLVGKHDYLSLMCCLPYLTRFHQNKHLSFASFVRDEEKALNAMEEYLSSTSEPHPIVMKALEGFVARVDPKIYTAHQERVSRRMNETLRHEMGSGPSRSIARRL